MLSETGHSGRRPRIKANQCSFIARKRLALRLEKLQPMVLEMETEFKRLSRGALSANALGQAAKYTLSLWVSLNRVLENPDLESSTNLAENSMRRIALDRKNWIQVGSPVAGPKEELS